MTLQVTPAVITMRLDREQILKDLRAIAELLIFIGTIALALGVPMGIAYFKYSVPIGEAFSKTLMLWWVIIVGTILLDDYLPALKARYTVQEQNRTSDG